MIASILRVFAVATFVAGTSLPAAAHAFLEKASPRAGENLRAGPPRIELHFTEALEPDFSGIAVTDETGLDMDSGVVAVDGAVMSVPLKTLRPGRYRVRWHAVSVDTHRTEGTYNFVVAP